MAEPNSLDELYMIYMKDVYHYLLYLCQDPFAAEDIVQETFYRAYLYLDSYQGERVKPWLFQVAHHALIDYKRKENRAKPQEPSFFEDISDPITPELQFLRKERISEWGQAIGKLPYKQKQALLLHDWHQLTYQESADIMGIGLSYYKVILFRARQALRQQHAEGGNDD
ncbi:RNA polymerase sigma factor [Paenibacillus paridis]|uniref:RNA polymerase sigma factor n=1 Tax=Paenibacillus paridis TaxID=2583376 RepID=UPI001EE4D54A|nr:sigma-70 family RNA polymerase sigma factor [Paenibacillus paridis]